MPFAFCACSIRALTSSGSNSSMFRALNSSIRTGGAALGLCTTMAAFRCLAWSLRRYKCIMLSMAIRIVFQAFPIHLHDLQCIIVDLLWECLAELPQSKISVIIPIISDEYLTGSYLTPSIDHVLLDLGLMLLNLSKCSPQDGNLVHLILASLWSICVSQISSLLNCEQMLVGVYSHPGIAIFAVFVAFFSEMRYCQMRLLMIAMVMVQTRGLAYGKKFTKWIDTVFREYDMGTNLIPLSTRPCGPHAKLSDVDSIAGSRQIAKSAAANR